MLIDTPTICTVIAKNYLAAARTMCESFLLQHPDGKCFVLVVDEIEGFVDPAPEQFEIVSLESLNIPNHFSFCFKYDLLELCTAAKPFLIDYLLSKEGIDKILYLDPDTYVTNPLIELYRMLDAHSCLLTPHLNEDYPLDGKSPQDNIIYTYGIFNLGFIGVRNDPEALRFLRWWQSKVYDRCVIDAEKGLYLDQRFIDLAVVLFRNIRVVDEAGYNVAWWNLHSRNISYNGKHWKCNSERLFFYHFSGFDPHKPKLISRHQNRIPTNENPDLLTLFQEYSDKLLKNQYAESIQWPSGFSQFANGDSISSNVRRFYRNNPDDWSTFGNPFESEALIMWSARHRHTKRVRSILRSVFNKILNPQNRKHLDALLRTGSFAQNS